MTDLSSIPYGHNSPLPHPANAGAERSMMETFDFYMPKGNEPKQKLTVADLIPVGRDNAISRKSLLALCIAHDLIEANGKDQDRQMRRLINQARLDYTILNLSNGRGYYRPSHDDLLDLQRYLRQEESRAKATFRNISNAKALYEDYKHGRIEVD